MDIKITEIERVDAAVWAGAREVLRERTYGEVVVSAVWPEGEIGETAELMLEVRGGEASEASTFAEIFIHDAFLILNIASPGSFGGTFAIPNAGGITLDPRVFVYASAKETLPPALVARWYDELNPGYEEAGTPMAKALFHLLHLARTPEDELLSVVRLAEAAAALGITRQKVFELLRGEIPAIHPVSENDDRSLQWIDAADLAAAAVVGAIQNEVRRGAK